MSKKTCLRLAIGLVTLVGMFAIAETLDAKQEGLGGRAFMVVVQQVSGTDIGIVPFTNCYLFYLDGTWEETGMPTGGMWTQHNNGSRPQYSVDGTAGGGTFPFEQVGQVKPDRTTRILQLVADSIVDLSLAGLGELGFLSVGFEIPMALAGPDDGVCPYPDE
jgi:hypothetical protein